MPMINRPLLMTSRVAPILASIAGFRYGMPVTMVPNLIRDVTAAIAAKEVYDSSNGASAGSSWGIWMK